MADAGRALMLAADTNLATVEQRHMLAVAYNCHGASGPVLKVILLTHLVAPTPLNQGLRGEID